MYTVHFLSALLPWGGKGYDSITDKRHQKTTLSSIQVLVNPFQFYIFTG